MNELERILAFLRDLALSCARRTEDSPFGIAVLNDDLPRVWSLNYLLAERNLDSATAQLLAAESDRILGAAGLAHRKVELLDQRHGDRLEREFGELGWLVECDVVMVARREPEESDAEEVGAGELEPVWAEGTRAEPFGSDEETVRQLVEHKHVLREAVGTRFFGARADGRLASYCDLYVADGVGQIEAVITLEPFRNRGLARSVVSKAHAASIAAGNDLTFLVAMRDDWPKELYRKLGFEEVGRVYEFRRRV